LLIAHVVTDHIAPYFGCCEELAYPDLLVLLVLLFFHVLDKVFIHLLVLLLTEVKLIKSGKARVVVSVLRRSRDVFFKRLGLVSVSAKCGKVSVSISSWTESQTSRSRLGLGPQRLVYKWTFKHIFQFLSF